MPSRLPSPKLVLLLLLPCMLALGIWLGGHPRFLVDPVADVLVGPQDRRITLEALDTIDDKYYREVDRGKLSDAALAGAVKDLDDRFSAYLSPKEYGQFEQALDNAFSGVGTAVARRRGRPADRDRLPELAGEAGRPARRRHRHARQRPQARGPRRAGRHGAHQGPRGHAGHADAAARRAHVQAAHDARADRGAGRRVADRQRRRRARRLHRAVDVRPADRRTSRWPTRSGGSSAAGRRASSSTCAATAAASSPRRSSSRACSSPTGRSSRRAGARSRSRRSRPSASRSPASCRPSCSSTATRPRRRRSSPARCRTASAPSSSATRTFGKGVFQEILPLDNGGALDITVGQYFLPSGRNLGGAGTKPGSGPEARRRRAQRRHDAEGDEQLERALDVLADEL